MLRQRKPRIDIIGHENDNVVVLRTEKPGKWVVKCKKCGGEHEQTSREICRNSAPRSCDKFKPFNWTGLEREDVIIRRQYGISMQEFDELLQMQNNSCAICNKSIEALRRRMNIDHCHDTNKVRGILCTGCNTGLGHLGDNIEGLEKAIQYLKNPPANNLVRR